ncbi:MAG: ATP-dependent DNA helicase RecG [Pirellulaceae bacterium]|nr:ATP-dependent DNA helicase RecG [Pirellulaceae bacterium]
MTFCYNCRMTTADRQDARQRLATPIQFVKGIGPQLAPLLERLELRTAADLLFFFPRDYHDASRLLAIHELEEDQPASVCGVVEEIELRNTGTGRSLLGVLVRQDREYLRAMWFNQPYMRERFRLGSRVLLSGTPRFHGGRWEMVHPRVEGLEGDRQVESGSILPLYSLTEGLKQPHLRRIVRSAVDAYAGLLDEVFPAEYLSAHGLMPIQTAVTEIHAPRDPASLAQARRRFIYQELLVLQVALALRKQQRAQLTRTPPLVADAKIDARIRRLFPFDLTAAQNQAIQEITADLARPRPMNRLLQGDVGSGKTVVAEYAMLVAVAHGYQAALMAPTEILARQHAATLQRDLRESRVRIRVLTGSLTAAQRREVRDQLAAGEADLIVGTHALLQEELDWSKLALVIIDEQHKFGVNQRAALRRSASDPHYLVMTATPIPRTVSMTLFGDLDMSVLRDPPPGRAAVHTYLGVEAERGRWWEFFRKKLREGRQGYVIAPHVESAEDEAVASVQQAFEALANGELADFRLDLMHGRLGAEEKESVMRDFQAGKTQVLVATSVVEVGIDVPNATLMTIEDADRFGLAQLHQMRGRVSRGVHPGYVCVFAELKTGQARERLDAFCRSNDGFELAEIDFQLRGPGSLFSLQQHGLPAFHIADLVRDSDALTEARRDAQTLVGDGMLLARPEFARLRQMAARRYGQALELADVG